MSSFSVFISNPRALFPAILVLVFSSCAFAQSSVLPENASSTEAIQRRIERARALAAAHQLQLAAVELENVRASSHDVMIRNISTLMLMNIYLEDGNYGRARALLEDTFQARLSQKDESVHTYFALAGQAINGVRAHLEHYRGYGINPADRTLPVEALADLDRVRDLLEVMVNQAKDVAKDEGRSSDALALQEDTLGLRLSLAKDNDDRQKWEAEYASVRERLAASQVQVASIRQPALSSVTSRIPNPFALPKPSPTPAAPEPNSDSSSTSPAVQTTTSTTTPAPDSTSTSGSEPKLVSTGSLTGRESKRVSPVYPALAKSTGVNGTVRVFAIIDENGKVWVTNSEGPQLLRKAAEDAAKNWLFPPTIMSGKTVRLAGYIDFDFKM